MNTATVPSDERENGECRVKHASCIYLCFHILKYIYQNFISIPQLFQETRFCCFRDSHNLGLEHFVLWGCIGKQRQWFSWILTWTKLVDKCWLRIRSCNSFNLCCIIKVLFHSEVFSCPSSRSILTFFYPLCLDLCSTNLLLIYVFNGLYRSYKELMAQCNNLGRAETRSRQNLDKAIEKIRKMKVSLL